jgi:2-dehydro-3-deoxyphosphogluconate aldolase/(4S)-4-hydroxy-2-oxoglutarate aldolase
LPGPRYLREVLAPLSEVRLIVTGGVSVANVRELLDAGAVAVGVGSALTGVTDIEAEARRLVAAVSSL